MIFEALTKWSGNWRSMKKQIAVFTIVTLGAIAAAGSPTRIRPSELSSLRRATGSRNEARLVSRKHLRQTARGERRRAPGGRRCVSGPRRCSAACSRWDFPPRAVRRTHRLSSSAGKRLRRRRALRQLPGLSSRDEEGFSSFFHASFVTMLLLPPRQSTKAYLTNR